MPRSARPILRLLALLLLVQWGGWPSPHASHPAAAGELTVICSPDGLREVRLGPDGKPAEPSPAPMGCCLTCQGPLAGADLLPPPRLPQPHVVAAPDVAMVEAVRQLSFSPPPTTRRSRAPPVS
ncbi:hypothetical protein [Roseomonas haemaphysalidis]|uniref:DUF2946 domain-containing protein n=1 Tax=Roseomonas haemaphysalidis TaxID=2768162 RepID=A0ABS3KPG4_9PROT|nr:hypothetical protein [Roseomonas haemaphysalidis]MBO1079324.1 hypothetical protein [Roseomonas haemaphysalidis]